MNVIKNFKSRTYFTFTNCRGTTFRREFVSLGEIRSILPEKVNCMAITATATSSTKKLICNTLGLIKPFFGHKEPQ